MSFLDVLFGGRAGPPPPSPTLDPSLDVTGPAVPPTFVFTLRERPKPLANLTYSGYPASNEGAGEWTANDPNGIGVSAWQDSPDPVRQSNFWNWGNKIHPAAGDITPLHTALWKSLIMQDSFMVGKVVNFWRPQMYAGAQLTSDIRRNITPGQAATFGSQYEVAGIGTPQPVVLSSGLSGSMDGDPYG
ncbi:MAG: hypothetical protein ABSF18_07690 [Gammaproteobacteria bacterium]|jgi:hypothetical protein